ncbi:YaaA family protein [Clostridium sp. AM58-1XD]|uniref:YaaA family protein n=1 Tax=Clostridium sp. AM58-1XD TaxID=2292307 RepID=UPI0026C78569
MNIIISPAKKMQVEADIIEKAGTPVFLDRAKKLLGILEGYTKEELKMLYKANDSITDLNYRRLKEMNLDTAVTPAVLAYVGLQYQSMAPRIFTDRQWEYVKKHLFILSGFYGILRAMDASCLTAWRCRQSWRRTEFRICMDTGGTACTENW